ncbi:translation initiation factor [Coraliomargarita parva]|uniref:translation initiation factor n=1 Tax=Coraliomargarita parva TaxID=3014050 RepID=UPI0022B42BCF|nr:translation initiation factor [Coraliomargarita parva]
MSRKQDKKISTDGGSELGSNPFGGLDLGGLPSGPAQSEAQPSKPAAKAPRKLGRVEVRREKAGRGGKTVTTLSAFATHLPLGQLDALCFDLKKSCACGGTLKGRVIELQGDVVQRVLPQLEAKGYQPVRAGG